MENHMLQWQEIETAPKDGTELLLWRPTMWGGKGHIGKGQWQTDEFAKRPRPFWESAEGWIGKAEDRGHPPTHWMPLPEPPKCK